MGTVGYSGDENYLARLAPQALASGVRTNLPEALVAMTTAPFKPHWAFYGVLPLGALLSALILRLRQPVPLQDCRLRTTQTKEERRRYGGVHGMPVLNS